MAGVWVFKNGVAKLVQNPMVESIDGNECGNMHNGDHYSYQGKRKVLVYVPTNEVMRSYGQLEEKLMMLGWERYPYNTDPDKLQYHRCFSSSLLISLPRDFSKFKTMHMFDIVLKNRESFEVRDQL